MNPGKKTANFSLVLLDDFAKPWMMILDNSGQVLKVLHGHPPAQPPHSSLHSSPLCYIKTDKVGRIIQYDHNCEVPKSSIKCVTRFTYLFSYLFTYLPH